MERRGENRKFETPPVASPVEGCIKPFFREKERKRTYEGNKNGCKLMESRGKNWKFETPPVTPPVEGGIKPFFSKKERKRK